MRTRRHTMLARCARRLRVIARVLAVVVVLLGVFGNATAMAAEAYARTAAVPTCKCPHGDADEKACACCHRDGSEGGCLPVGAGSCGGALALAPAIEAPLQLPMPPLLGLLTEPEVSPLLGRTAALRLERPPRA